MTSWPKLLYQQREQLSAQMAQMAGQAAQPTAYLHDQDTPATVWTINHNLNRYPIISIFSYGRQEVIADVVHTNENQAVASFVVPFQGVARCV